MTFHLFVSHTPCGDASIFAKKDQDGPEVVGDSKRTNSTAEENDSNKRTRDVDEIENEEATLGGAKKKSKLVPADCENNNVEESMIETSEHREDEIKERHDDRFGMHRLNDPISKTNPRWVE